MTNEEVGSAGGMDPTGPPTTPDSGDTPAPRNVLYRDGCSPACFSGPYEGEQVGTVVGGAGLDVRVFRTTEHERTAHHSGDKFCIKGFSHWIAADKATEFFERQAVEAEQRAVTLRRAALFIAEARAQQSGRTIAPEDRT